MAKNFKTLSDRLRSDPKAAADIDARKEAIYTGLALAELRNHRELTQADIARVMSVSQANVSRIERQEDVYLSTLKAFIEAIGGELEMTAVFPDERVPLAAPAGHR